MRFYLVDKIEKIILWKSLIGKKNISYSDTLFFKEDQKSISSKSVAFPELLVCESLLQAGAWLVVSSSNKTKRPIVLSIDTINCFEFAHIGDEVILLVEMNYRTDEMACIDGTAKVNGKTILSFTNCILSFLDTKDLETEEQTKVMYELLFRDVKKNVTK